MPSSQVTGQSVGLERAIDIARRAVALITERLPPGWSARIAEERLASGRRVDVVVEVTAPDQQTATILVKAKSAILVRDLAAVVDQLRAAGRGFNPPPVPMVVARYLDASARQWLEAYGISYADTTGNVRVLLEQPALFVRDRGADRDPWRRPGRPRGTLQGPPAARVVRALVDFSPPMTVPELVRRSGASTGATYRVVEFLEQQALVERERRGPITTVQWRPLLERWTDDYGFQRSNRVGAYLSPRGLPALLDGLKRSAGLRYVLTGSLSAYRLAPYAPARLAMLYVDGLEQAVERLDLRAVDGGANVLLATGGYDVVFDRATVADGLLWAAPSQTVVDLLSGPGRSPSEGQALLDWMERNEPAWRQ